MADNETRVVYKAIGDFASLSRSLGAARRNLAALRKEQAAFNAESIAGSAAAAAANDKSTKSQKASNAAAGESVSIYDAAAAAMARASAARADHAAKSKQAADADRDASSATERLAAASERLEGALGRAASAFEKATGSQRRYEQQNRRTQTSQNGVINGAQRVLGAFQKLGSFKPDIVPPFIALIPAIAGVIALLGPLTSGLGAVGAAAIGFGSSLGSLAGSALGVAPALAGLLSLVGALKVAFGGVGNAFKTYGAMQKAAGGGGGGGAKANKQIEITQAEKIARANEQVRRSTQDVQFAEDDLDAARKDYLKRVQDLQKAIDRYAVSQARASANTRLAQENYANVLADPGSTKGQKMDAAAGVQEAMDAQKDAAAQQKQDQSDLAALKKTGINGDRQVIQAQRAVTDAINAQRDAQIALLNAQKGTTEAAGGGASAAAAYQDALDKLSPSARSVVKQLIAMKGAWDAMQRTVQESFFSEIVGDIQLLTRLFPPVTGLLSAFASEAGKVSSNFLKMVTSDEWIADIKTFGKEASPIVGTIGDGLLSLLQGFKDITIAATPFTAAIIGDLTKIAKGFERVTDQGRRDGSLQAYLKRVQGRLEQWGRIVVNVGTALINYGSAASDFGDWLTDGFEGVTAGWADASKAAREDGSPFKKFLEDIKPLLKNLNGLLGDFFGWIGKTVSDPKFIDQMNNITTIIRDDLGPAIGDIIKVLGETGVGQALVETISEIAEALAAVLDNGGADAIKVFFGVLKTIVGVIKDLAGLPGGGAVIVTVLGALGALAAITTVGKFTGLFTLFGWLLKLSKSAGVLKLLDKLKGGITGLASRGGKGGKGGGSSGSGSLDLYTSGDGRETKSSTSSGKSTSHRPIIVDPETGPTTRTRGSGLFGRGTPNISSMPSKGGRLTGGAKAVGSALLDLLGLGGLKGAGKTVGGSVAGKAGILGKAGGVLGGLGKAGGGLLRGFGPGAVLSIGGSLAGDAIAGGAAKGSAGAGQRVGGNILSGAASGAGIGATIGGAVGSVVPGLGTAVGAGVGGAIGGVAGGASAFFKADPKDKQKFLDDIKDFFTKTVPDFFKGLGSSIWDGLTSFGQWLQDTWVAAGEWLQNLPKNISYAAGQIWGLIQNFGDWLVDAWVAAGEWIRGLPQRIADTAADIWRFIKGFGKWLGEQWTAAREWVAGLPKRIADTASDIWKFIKGLPKWLRETWAGAVDWVRGLPKRVGDAAGDIWDGIKGIGSWLAKQGGKVKDWATGLAGNIGDWVGDAFSGLGDSFKQGEKSTRNKNNRHNGGPIKRAGGGPVPGAGNSDTVPAMLTPGEYVLRKAIGARIGQDNLNRLNSGVLTYAQLLQRLMQSGKEGKATAGGGGISFLNGGGLVPGGDGTGSTPTFGGGSSTPPPAYASISRSNGGSSGDGGFHVENLVINNPKQETSSESLPRAIRRTSSLGAFRKEGSGK